MRSSQRIGTETFGRRVPLSLNLLNITFEFDSLSFCVFPDLIDF